MEKLLELVDAWMKSQKEFMDNWAKSQKEFMDSWTEASRKLQESFGKVGLPQEGPAKEMMNIYNSWASTMMNSSKVFAEEAAKIQDSWKVSIEKQMDMSREMLKSLSERFAQTGAGR